MLENIIVIGIVGVAAAMAGRSLYKTMTGKNEGGGCSGCAGNCHSCTNRYLEEMDQKQNTKKGG